MEIGPDLAVRRRSRTGLPSVECLLQLVTLGRAGAAEDRRTTDNSRWRRSADRAGEQPFPSVRAGRPNDPDCLSHGGSQRFKSPHLQPTNQQVRASSVSSAALLSSRGRHGPRAEPPADSPRRTFPTSRRIRCLEGEYRLRAQALVSSHVPAQVRHLPHSWPDSAVRL